MRQFADAAADHLGLVAWASHPDALLLNFCAEALRHLTAAAEAYGERPNWGVALYTPALGAEDDRLMRLYNDSMERARTPLGRITRLRAATAAGIYARAACFRASRMGRPRPAMSLATDLLNNADLRRALWSVEPEAPPA